MTTRPDPSAKAAATTWSGCLLLALLLLIARYGGSDDSESVRIDGWNDGRRRGLSAAGLVRYSDPHTVLRKRTDQAQVAQKSTTATENRFVQAVVPPTSGPLGDADTASLERVDSVPAAAAAGVGSDSPPPPLFLHVAKSGGSNVKNFLRTCFGLRITHVVRGNTQSVEADHQRRLFSEADILVGNVADVARNVYSPDRRGRVFTVLRHPVEVVISNYYYRQVAYWEKSYSPELKDVPLETFALQRGLDNVLVRRLMNKGGTSPLGTEDLDGCKAFLRDHVLVGLTDRMGESLERIDRYFGFSNGVGSGGGGGKVRRCKERYYGGTGANRNEHPSLDPDGETWKRISDRHSLDVQLYSYALELFEEQSRLFGR